MELYFLLVLFGGVVALDTTAVAQVMISRPLVSASLAGALLGDPVAGILVGVALELFILPVLPVGGGRFPEGGPAGVVAGALAASGGTAGAWALGFGVGVVWAILGGLSLETLRRWNGRIAPGPGHPALDSARLTARHLAPLVLDFFRGALLVSAGLLAWLPLARIMDQFWPLAASTTVALGGLAIMVPLGMTLRVLGPEGRRLSYFILGLGLGLLPVALGFR